MIKVVCSGSVGGGLVSRVKRHSLPQASAGNHRTSIAGTMILPKGSRFSIRILKKERLSPDATASLFGQFLSGESYEPVAVAGATSRGGLVMMAMMTASTPRPVPTMKAAL